MQERSSLEGDSEVVKAIVYTRYGSPDVLEYADVPKPVPKDNEVLVRVRAASVNPLDWRFMRGRPVLIRPMLGGFGRPRLMQLGVDVAGEVESVGAGVTHFKLGDPVFGVCRGAFAEYACTLERKLTAKPASVSFEEAAAIPVAAVSALQGLRDHGRIQRGQEVLVDGASGGVGTFAVQIAKLFGARVTAVCSTRNVDRARSLGADSVLDYTREDFTRSDQRYDLILASNAHRSLFDYRRALARNGVYVMVGGGTAQMLQTISLAPLVSLFGRKKMRFFIARIDTADLAFLGDRVAARDVVPIIDRTYGLREAAEAVRYLEEGHAQGKVVITI